jgi:hypothetical protein
MPNTSTSFRDYNDSFTQKVENALLDVWALMGAYRDDLVLIGGLAPRYITAPQNTRDYSLTRHCGTMDIDLGVSIAVSNQPRYKEIIDILKQAGFQNAVNDRGNLKHHSFVKEEDGEKIVIDFLTTEYDGPDDSRMHQISEDISAIQTLGLGLGFINPLKCHVSRIFPDGTIAEEIINVCRPVAYIVLKALAFDNRRKDKDVYDLIFVLENYKSGVDSVIAEILQKDLQADSFSKAIECLERHFRDLNQIGPRAYAKFMGNSTLQPQAYAIVQEFLQKTKKLLKEK